MRRPDHFDSETVVRFHQPHQPYPVGYDVCCGCLRITDQVYWRWPVCRSCADSFCPDCSVPGSEQDHDDEPTVVCKDCQQAEQEARVLMTCDGCGREGVATVEVQTERWPDIYERRCQRCNPKAWETQEAWEGRYEAI